MVVCVCVRVCVCARATVCVCGVGTSNPRRADNDLGNEEGAVPVTRIFNAVLRSGTMTSLNLSGAQLFLYSSVKREVISSNETFQVRVVLCSCGCTSFYLRVICVTDFRVRNRQSFVEGDNVRLHKLHSDEYVLDVPVFGWYARGWHLWKRDE